MRALLLLAAARAATEYEDCEHAITIFKYPSMASGLEFAVRFSDCCAIFRMSHCFDRFGLWTKSKEVQQSVRRVLAAGLACTASSTRRA